MHRVEHRVDCTDTKAGLVEAEGGNATVDPAITERLNKIQSYISDGAKAFLFSEYEILAGFIVLFGIFVLVFLGIPTRFSISAAFFFASFLETASWMRIVSAIWLPTFIMGFRAVIGS